MNILSTLAIAAVGFLVLQRVLGGKKVSSHIVKQKLESGAFVLDVRTPEEFRAGAYPGAKNIPISELERRMGEIPRGKAIVVYCASGMRSATAEHMMRLAGFADIVNAGGLGAMPR